MDCDVNGHRASLQTVLDAETDTLDQARFKKYVLAANQSGQDLEFLLENLGHPTIVDFSTESLAKTESVFWRCVSEGLPQALGSLDDFAELLGRYFGECVIRHTVQSGSSVPTQIFCLVNPSSRDSELLQRSTLPG